MIGKDINYKFVNDLLKKIGFENVIITPTPIFLWNGNTITDDETAQPKQVSVLVIEDGNLLNFLGKNRNRKIVICPHHDSNDVINEDNLIKVFIE